MTEDTNEFEAALKALHTRYRALEPAAGFTARVMGRIGSVARGHGEVLRLIHGLAKDPKALARVEAARSRSEMVELLMRLGGERGVQVSAAAVTGVFAGLRAANDDGELSDDELQAVAGGAADPLRSLWEVFARLK